MISKTAKTDEVLYGTDDWLFASFPSTAVIYGIQRILNQPLILKEHSA